MSQIQQTLLIISHFFWLADFTVPFRLSLTSRKLVLAKTSNKHPYTKVEVLGAHLRLGVYLMGKGSTYLIIFLIGWVLVDVFIINTFLNENIKMITNLSL